jgi:GxxExxY protein
LTNYPQPSSSKATHPRENQLTENEITGIVVDTALTIHRRLGPGLLESAYQSILAFELRKRGLEIATEVPISIEWDEIRLDVGFRADMIVDHRVILELKSLESVAPVHKKQLLTYLRLTNLRVGLLINFGAELLKDGIKRVANGIRD